MNKFIDFILQENRTQSESLIKYRTKFMNIVGVLTAIVAFVMSFIRFYREEYFVAIVDFVASIIIFYIVYLIKIKPHYLKRVIQIFVFLIFIFTFILIINVHYDTRMAFPFMFLSSVIFLQGKRAGLYWFIVFTVVYLILYITAISVEKFSLIELIMMFVLLIIHYSILLVYENQQNESSERLLEINRNLDKVIKDRTKELNNQKEAFETLYNKSSDGVLLIQDGRVVDCNESVLKLFKYSTKEEFLKKHPSEFSPKVQPGGRSSLEKADDMIEQCLKKGAYGFEWVHQKFDGEIFWCDIILTKLMLQDKLTIHAVLRDIGERKVLEKKIQNQAFKLEEFNATLEQKVELQVAKIQESLENFKILIDSTIEGIIVYDNEKGILDCNLAGLKLFKYSRDEIIGKNISDIIHKDDQAKVLSKLEEENIEAYEAVAIDSANTIIPILISGANMYYNGIPVHIITIFDLSELKEKDKLLQQQSRHATMGEMIGMIAHQWRQPLAAITGSTGVIKLDIIMGNYDEELFETQIDKITEQTQFLSSTIDDFRNFFKENKKKTYTTLENITDSALKIIGSTLENREIEIIKKYKSTGELNTYTNELKQVVLNLLKNAQDAMLENDVKEPKIEIITYRDKEQFILEICDNGGGIPANVIDSIFEPYFTTREKRDGTGLGLYMSKTIVEEHCGGKISVSNTEVGAKFKIILEDGMCINE